MELRPYQLECVEAVEAFYKSGDSALIVLPTGTGKTVIFSYLIRRLDDRGKTGRVMVLVHREELAFQAADKIERVTGQKPDLDMNVFHADEDYWNKSRVVVASVQTLNAKKGNGYRMGKFDPSRFDMVIIDEAHHAVADTYQRVVNHFRQNLACKILGVTATPDRLDEAALKQVFDDCPYDYELPDAIHDGWLVPIRQSRIHINSLDLSKVKTVAGDLNGAELAACMETERNLHEVAGPTMEIAAGRRTLVFTASVAQAERLAEIFGRHGVTAEYISAKTPKEERRRILAEYENGTTQMLCNVGIFTEGFDCPGVQIISMARPTKSRSLFAQMLGRGTRVMPSDLVDGVDASRQNSSEAQIRRQMIAESDKPHLDVIDFTGNSGKHELISTVDILGGKMEDAVVARAKADATVELTEVNTMLDEAQKALAEEERKRESQLTQAKRSNVRATVSYHAEILDTFSVLGLRPWREKAWDTGKDISPRMAQVLERNGFKASQMTYTEARQIISEIVKRWDDKSASIKQVKKLKEFDYENAEKLTFAQARALLDKIAANNWQRPKDQPAPATEPQSPPAPKPGKEQIVMF